MAQDLQGPVSVSEDTSLLLTQLTGRTITVGRLPKNVYVRDGRVYILRPNLSRFAKLLKVREGIFGGTRSASESGRESRPSDSEGPEMTGALVDVGSKEQHGAVTLRNRHDVVVIDLDGESGTVTVGTETGSPGRVVVQSGRPGPAIIIDGKQGRLMCVDDELTETLVIDAKRGDIELKGGDLAEDFYATDDCVPGTVVVVDECRRLRPSSNPYDPSVAGVVAGAGDLKPSVRLGRMPGVERAAPLAMTGTVYCLAEADSVPIRSGDLLTTSSVLGHAMRAVDRDRAFGSVIGKSLGRLDNGRGLVPMIVSLR